MSRRGEVSPKGLGKNLSSFFLRLWKALSRGVPVNCLRTLTRIKSESTSPSVSSGKGKSHGSVKQYPPLSRSNARGAPKSSRRSSRYRYTVRLLTSSSAARRSTLGKAPFWISRERQYNLKRSERRAGETFSPKTRPLLCLFFIIPPQARTLCSLSRFLRHSRSAAATAPWGERQKAYPLPGEGVSRALSSQGPKLY